VHRRPFPSALAAALCAHAFVVIAILVGPRLRSPVSAKEASPQELVFVTEEGPPSAPPAPATEPTPTDSPTSALPPRDARTATASPDPAGRASADPAEPPAAAPSPAASSDRWSLPRAAPPIDLGVGTYWKSVALGPAQPPPAAEARPEGPPSTDKLLRDALQARDLELGLGSEGPLISAAHEAASPSLAPDVGSATLEIESDATGKVTTARVVSGAADLPAWNDVAREIVRLSAAKRLHLPRGARGLRTQLRITAERTLPSGEKAQRTAGAVPDDACVGAGATRKCNAGLPMGAGIGFDMSDIGAHASRIVRVQLLGEVAL
jgi:hypothetical protein